MVRKSLNARALSVLVLLTVAACSGSKEAAPPSTTTPSSAPTPSPTATADPGELAIAAYETYTRLSDQATAAGRVNPTLQQKLEAVATGHQIEQTIASVKSMAAQDYTASGYTKVNPKVVGIEEQGTVVDLKDCIDVRGIKVINAAGKDTRLKGSPVLIPVEAEVTLSPASGGVERWLVSEVRYDFRGTKCA